MSWLRDFSKSYDKTSCGILKWGYNSTSGMQYQEAGLSASVSMTNVHYQTILKRMQEAVFSIRIVITRKGMVNAGNDTATINVWTIPWEFSIYQIWMDLIVF